jgi:hypothetical protein
MQPIYRFVRHFTVANAVERAELRVQDEIYNLAQMKADPESKRRALRRSEEYSRVIRCVELSDMTNEPANPA